MERLGHLGILLVIVALLPWGAWTGARVAPLVAAVAAAEAGGMDEAPRAGAALPDRGCRTGVLPGACEVKALGASVVLAGGRGGAVVLRPGDMVLGKGVTRAPPRDPPRGLQA